MCGLDHVDCTCHHGSMRANRANSLGVSAVGLMAAVALGAIAFELGPLRFGWTPTIANVVLLVVLIAIDQGATRSFPESVAYAMSCGFLLATAAIFPLFYFLPEMAVSPADAFSAKPWLPLICLVGMIGFLALDRVRNNTKPIALQMLDVDHSTTTAIARSTDAAPELAKPWIPETSNLPVVSAPARAIVPPGAVSATPAVIHINLMNAGVACLRPVQAEHLGRDFYKVVEPVPGGGAMGVSAGASRPMPEENTIER